MKKIFLLASIVLMVMSGCSKNEVIETAESQKAISFENYLHKATKATTNDKTAMEGGITNLYSYVIGTTNGDYSQVESQFFNDQLSYASSTWKTNVTRYWPSQMKGTPSKSLSFFAYFPNGATGLEYDESAFTGKTGNPKFTYSVPSEAASQQDVLVSMAINKTYENTTPKGQVSFTFSHALTQIQIEARGNTSFVKYKITNVTIGKDATTNNLLKYSNTFTYGNDFASSSWGTASADVTSYVYPLKSTSVEIDDMANSTPSTTYVCLANDNNNLMLLPQTLTEGTTIQISYSVEDPSGHELASFNNRTAIISGEWVKGNKYIYQLTLPSDLTPITYDVVEVDNWNNSNITGTLE